jgi:group I intron endonuclease
MRLYNKVQALKMLNQHLGVYPTPMNLNWNWSWGSLSGLLLGSQIITGILLAMHYVGHVDHAFASVQHLMVDVPSGLILRYAHANGASLFFTVVYLHVLRGIYYSSGTQPREILWISGVVILLLMIITAFIGYNYSQKWIFNVLYEDYTYFLSHVTHKIDFRPLSYLSVVSSHVLSCPFEGVEQLLCNEIFLLNINSKDGVKLSITPVKSYNNLHLKQTQYTILTDNKQKACVYLIYNTINGNSYIGSAISNRISMRFRNHCIHNTGGNKPLTRAIHKYGLDKFSFHILEYFTGFVLKENFNKNHLQLLELETSYLLKYKPIYNILPIAGSSVGLKHTEEAINKMKSNYSEQRREFIKNLNKDKEMSDSTKKLISDKRIELFKDVDFKTKFLLDIKHTLFQKKQVFLYNSNGVLISQYESVNMVSLVFSCDRKTVRKYLDNPNKMFKNIGYLKTSMIP